jgi:hypothetical protein
VRLIQSCLMLVDVHELTLESERECVNLN